MARSIADVVDTPHTNFGGSQDQRCRHRRAGAHSYGIDREASLAGGGR